MNEEQPHVSYDKAQHQHINSIEPKYQEFAPPDQKVTRYGRKSKTVNRLIKAMMIEVNQDTKN